MSELWLKYSNSDGSQNRVAVEGQKFTIGRHSSNDLSIVDGRLSREHLSIERFGDVFVVSDCGSSNGSSLNDEKLDAPVALKPGDVLDLGGVRIETEFEGQDTAEDNGDAAEPADAEAVNVPLPTSIPAESASSIPTSVFFIAPLLGVVILGLLAGLFYFAGGRGQPEIAANEFQLSTDDPDDPPVKEIETDATPRAGKTPEAVSNLGTANSTDGPTPQKSDLSESAKVEQAGGMFLRGIAQNDPKAFLTGEQAQKVASRIKQLSGDSALAANIASAKQNAAQIRSLAASTNLKPQFVAVAAMTKLGTRRGDVAKTAQAMSSTLEQLRTQLGSELADDTLLMV
ncbi:MAG TPA: FHA domain-containing protein, partial [Pyrinomonadaceae bacterium]|nr:FHA domain-containing protein [Pyrinomonadaceae bacterium]